MVFRIKKSQSARVGPGIFYQDMFASSRFRCLTLLALGQDLQGTLKNRRIV